MIQVRIQESKKGLIGRSIRDFIHEHIQVAFVSNQQVLFRHPFKVLNSLDKKIVQLQ
jgi:hypothetical protein